LTACRCVSTQIEDKKGSIPLLDERYFVLVKEDRQMNLRLYNVQKPLPRANFFPAFRWVEQSEEIENILSNPDQHGFSPEKECLVDRNNVLGQDKEQPGATLLSPTLPQPPVVSVQTSATATGSKQSVSILVDRPQHVSISIATGQPGWLVLSDHFYPGWTASIDSVPRAMYLANAESRAVYVPEGQHLVQFSYRPPSLYLGLSLAGFAALLLVLFAFWALAPHTLKVLRIWSGQE